MPAELTTNPTGLSQSLHCQWSRFCAYTTQRDCERPTGYALVKLDRFISSNRACSFGESKAGFRTIGVNSEIAYFQWRSLLPSESASLCNHATHLASHCISLSCLSLGGGLVGIRFCAFSLWNFRSGTNELIIGIVGLVVQIPTICDKWAGSKTKEGGIEET